MAKKDTLAHKRIAFETLGDHRLVRLLFSDIAPRFNDRSSGFIRILHVGMRRGDDAPLAILELTQIKEKKKKPKAKKQAAEAAEQKPEAPRQKSAEEAKPVVEKAVAVEKTPEKHKQVLPKKPAKKFFGGIRSIFKKERDSL
jgi:large subunit ribosomal protein L17